MSFVCCISTTLFSEFFVVCKTNVIWFGEGKYIQDHWKKIPILVYIILGFVTYYPVSSGASLSSNILELIDSY